MKEMSPRGTAVSNQGATGPANGDLFPVAVAGRATGCPLCGSQQALRVQTLEVMSVVRRWRQCYQIDVARQFGDLASFELFQCQVCSLRYFSPRWLAGSSELYEQLEKQNWYYLPRKWEHDIALRDLRSCGRVIEVGCGFGDFLAFARAEAQLEVEGLEQNESAVRTARGRGLPVRRLDIGEAAARFPGSYDAVCIFQVLEHVPNPGEFLRAACALLKLGGMLLLGLPNAESFLRYEFNPLDLPPHHMTRWTKQVLQQLPRMLPIRLERVRLEPLAENHVDCYTDAYCCAWARKTGLGWLGHPRVKGIVAKFIRHSGIRRALLGHTLYARYRRV